MKRWRPSIVTSSQSLTHEQKVSEYPKWEKLIEAFPVRWQGALSGSHARLVSFDGGYIIDINDFDKEAFREAVSEVEFRSELSKLIVPWAFNHPIINGAHRCKGISFGNDLRDDVTTLLIKELGAKLIAFIPYKWDKIEQEEV
jgi:hypothetical protein